MLKPFRTFVRYRYWALAACGLASGWALHRPAQLSPLCEPAASAENAVESAAPGAWEPGPPPPLSTTSAVVPCQYEDESSFVPVVAPAPLPHSDWDEDAAPASLPPAFATAADGTQRTGSTGMEHTSITAESSSPSKVPARRSDPPLTRMAQTCQLTDGQTGLPVATLKICQQVREDRLAAGSGTADTSRMRPAPRQAPQLPVVRDGHRPGRLEPYPPFLEIRGSQIDAAVEVDARNVELAELVREFAAHFRLPIEVDAPLQGTMTAQIHAVNASAALEAMLQSVGMSLAIREDRAWLVTSSRLDSREDRPRLAESTEPAGEDRPVDRPAEAPTADRVALVSYVATDQVASGDREPVTAPFEGGKSAGDCLPVETPVPVATEVVSALPVEDVLWQAQAAAAAGDLDRAIDILSTAICHDSREVRWVQQLARIYLAKGDTASALVAAEQSLACDRYNPESNALMGDVLEAIGQATRAQHYRDQARFLQSRQR